MMNHAVFCFCFSSSISILWTSSFVSNRHPTLPPHHPPLQRPLFSIPCRRPINQRHRMNPLYPHCCSLRMCSPTPSPLFCRQCHQTNHRADPQTLPSCSWSPPVTSPSFCSFLSFFFRSFFLLRPR